MGISLTLNMYKVTTTFVNNQNHIWCKLIIVDNNTKMSYDPKENIRLTESDDYTEALKNHLKIDDFQYYSVLLHRKFLIVKI